MITDSSILAWKIPRAEESSGLQAIGSLRVGHDLATKQQQLFSGGRGWGKVGVGGGGTLNGLTL